MKLLSIFNILCLLFIGIAANAAPLSDDNGIGTREDAAGQAVEECGSVNEDNSHDVRITLFRTNKVVEKSVCFGIKASITKYHVNGGCACTFWTKGGCGDGYAGFIGSKEDQVGPPPGSTVNPNAHWYRCGEWAGP